MAGPTEDLQTQVIIARGGLDSNRNFIEMSQNNPGGAMTLQNFEPGLFGGYRRIDGFQYLEDTDSGEVDPTGAEGRILGIHFYNDNIYCQRKQQSGATYEHYLWVDGSSWSKVSSGSYTSNNVVRIRSKEFNFGGTDIIIFVDGVNNATMYNGTTWVSIDPTASGATYATAGGDQALSNPEYIEMFENHIFTAKGQIVAHSAPSTIYEGFDWTSASGGGQIPVGFDIKGIKAFREDLYIFGRDQIKKIVVENNNFVQKDVTKELGCVAADSIQEMNGDVYFLSYDGLRPISGTARIGDIELATVSKNIQQDLTSRIYNHSGPDIVSTLVRRKSQYRVFFSEDTEVLWMGSASDQATAANNDSVANGFLGGIKDLNGQSYWEYTTLKGINPSCTASKLFSDPQDEYVVFGGYDGKVYRQEQGDSFNGAEITAVYKTPYIDFGQPAIRKTLHEIVIFFRPEGETTINIGLDFDWNVSGIVVNPDAYTAIPVGSGSYFGTAIFTNSNYTFGGETQPITFTNVAGSGRSCSFTFSSNTVESSYSIQSIMYIYRMDGYL